MRKSNKKKPTKTLLNTGKEFQKELAKVGEKIRQYRIEKGYTSYEIFAFENNINRAQFGRYERGEDLRLSSLFKVLHALGIPPKEFFSEGFE